MPKCPKCNCAYVDNYEKGIIDGMAVYLTFNNERLEYILELLEQFIRDRDNQAKQATPN